MYTTIHGLCLTLELSTSFLETKIGASQVAWKIGAACGLPARCLVYITRHVTCWCTQMHAACTPNGHPAVHSMRQVVSSESLFHLWRLYILPLLYICL